MSCCDGEKQTVESGRPDPVAVARTAIVAAGRSLLGVPFLHQGRNPKIGLDCVGFWAEILKRIGVKEIHDLDAYKRVPSASTLIEYLRKNFDEIYLEDARIGDCLLMKMGGIKPRHVSLISDDRTDLARGIEPKMIHALCSPLTQRVTEQPISRYASGVVAAFRVPGVIEA